MGGLLSLHAKYSTGSQKKKKYENIGMRGGVRVVSAHIVILWI